MNAFLHIFCLHLLPDKYSFHLKTHASTNSKRRLRPPACRPSTVVPPTPSSFASGEDVCFLCLPLLPNVDFCSRPSCICYSVQTVPLPKNSDPHLLGLSFRSESFYRSTLSPLLLLSVVRLQGLKRPEGVVGPVSDRSCTIARDALALLFLVGLKRRGGVPLSPSVFPPLAITFIVPRMIVVDLTTFTRLRGGDSADRAIRRPRPFLFNFAAFARFSFNSPLKQAGAFRRFGLAYFFFTQAVISTHPQSHLVYYSYSKMLVATSAENCYDWRRLCFLCVVFIQEIAPPPLTFIPPPG